jgi:hypothetical protein
MYGYLWIIIRIRLEKCIICLISSPGYGISLVAETLNGYFISADISNNKNDESEIKEISTTDLTPEDLARKCALNLLEELFYVIDYLSSVEQLIHIIKD